MICAIAAIDSQKGIATDDGIPWKLPSDQIYFRDKTKHSTIVMGFRNYQTFKAPLPNRRNLVIVRPGTKLREGFEAVEDVDALVSEYQDNSETLWVVGGARIYTKLLPVTYELYLTRIQADFACTTFFPAFEGQFELIQQSVAHTENGLNFCYEVWASQPVLKQSQV